MNAYTQTKLALMTPQQRFPRPLVEGLMAEHEALRKMNADLRDVDEAPQYPADVIHNGKEYVVEEVRRLHKQMFGGMDSGKKQYTLAVPLVIVTEKP